MRLYYKKKYLVSSRYKLKRNEFTSYAIIK
jgi:hypothetical protein